MFLNMVQFPFLFSFFAGNSDPLSSGPDRCGPQKKSRYGIMGSGTDTKVAKLILDEIATHIHSLRETLVTKLSQQHKSTGSAHLADHNHGFFEEAYYDFVYLVVFGFNAIGLLIIVTTMLGIVPALVVHILPGMISSSEKSKKIQFHLWLESRMQLARGVILGMDLFVASDVVETLLHEVDLVKLFCVIAVRSWLGYERNKELEHMTKESEEDDDLAPEHHKNKKDK
jgi:uncharacterized membrane protein